MQRTVLKRRKQLSQQGVLQLARRTSWERLCFWCRPISKRGGSHRSMGRNFVFGLPARVSGAGFRDGGDPSGRLVVLSRFVVVVLLAGLFVCSPSAWGQINLVQVTTCASPGTSCTIPATGSGHLIVVGWSSAEGTAPTISAITDNANNAYVEATGARAVDTSVNMVDIWYAKNSNSGAA